MSSCSKSIALKARRIIKSELSLRGITHEMLACMLSQAGYPETVSGVKGKMHRGTFSFAWVLQCCEVLGIETLEVARVSMVTND